MLTLRLLQAGETSAFAATKASSLLIHGRLSLFLTRNDFLKKRRKPMLEIPALVRSAWTAIQPVLPIIAGEGAEKIGEHAVSKIWQAIKKKFDTQAAAKEALEELLKAPDDADVQGQFRAQLKKLLQEDASFAAELSKLLAAAGSEYKGQMIGGGALAQGNGATAVGQGGIYIGGNAGDVNAGKKK